MTTKTLLLLAFAIPLLTISAGCIKSDPNNQPKSTDSTLSFTERNNETGVRAEINRGAEIVITKTGTKVVPTKNYGTALNLYGTSGYRFQFTNCSGAPGTMTMKIGNKFMIDNRDDVAHKIKIGANSYQLGAYDFAIVTIEKAGSFDITCDGGGAANVLVQK